MSKTSNILITIDTDAVRRIAQKSTDPTTPIGIGHNLGYMVATGTKINSGQGTGDLSIAALVGDTIRAFAVSGSDNFEDAVLLYGMPRFQGDQVLSDFAYQSFTKSTVVPNSNTNPLPARIVEEQFWFYQASVIRKGTEGYKVQFGLYTRDETTGNPTLLGYYYWDPEVTVAG
jgi:hypothetical protein